MKIAIVTISDRASKGEYEDKSGPAIAAWLKQVISSLWQPVFRVIPDGMESVRDALIDLCDRERVDLILTTGGTGPSPRDLTPEAMAAVMEKELPGFGELMRRVSLEHVPTAILSRQTAGTRGKTLIINVPGKPDSIKVCLDAVFPAVPYCLDLIGAGRMETDAAVMEKELPGFGELMRRVSLEHVPTAILSCQTAGTRGRTLIINVPGKPDSIKVCLDAVFPAVPYCLDLIGAGRMETDAAVLKSFRPA